MKRRVWVIRMLSKPDKIFGPIGIRCGQVTLYSSLVLYWHWNYLPEKASCYFGNNKNSQGASFCEYMYVVARKLCVIVNSLVKIWSCTLSSKNYHLKFLRLSHYFGTHLTIFSKSLYYCDFDKSGITLQPSRNAELCFFPILIENIAYVFQLLWC